MSKMSKIRCIIVLILLLLTACNNTSGPDITNEQGENIMEEKLLTKDEFIQLIKENDVGVTIENFNGVDIDEFIAHYQISTQIFNKFITGDFILSGILEGFIELTPHWQKEQQLAPYLVQELKYVESTYEEYMDFISRYFKATGQPAAQIRIEDNGVLLYGYEIEGSGYFLYGFCQTSKSKKLTISRGEKDKDKNYTIKLYSGDESYYKNIYYSKSGKYLMYYDGNGEYSSYEEALNVIRTFCEMEDYGLLVGSSMF